MKKGCSYAEARDRTLQQQQESHYNQGWERGLQLQENQNHGLVGAKDKTNGTVQSYAAALKEKQDRNEGHVRTTEIGTHNSQGVDLDRLILNSGTSQKQQLRQSNSRQTEQHGTQQHQSQSGWQTLSTQNISQGHQQEQVCTYNRDRNAHTSAQVIGLIPAVQPVMAAATCLAHPSCDSNYVAQQLAAMEVQSKKHIDKLIEHTTKRMEHRIEQQLDNVYSKMGNLLSEMLAFNMNSETKEQRQKLLVGMIRNNFGNKFSEPLLNKLRKIEEEREARIDVGLTQEREISLQDDTTDPQQVLSPQRDRKGLEAKKHSRNQVNKSGTMVANGSKGIAGSSIPKSKTIRVTRSNT